MSMKNVTFEQAKKLYNIGFDEECRHNYVENPDGSFCIVDGELSDHEKQFNIYPAPYAYQAVEWLRDTHHILIGYLPVYPSLSPQYTLVVVNWNDKKGRFDCELNVKAFKSVDEAFIVGLDYVLTNLKTKE